MTRTLFLVLFVTLAGNSTIVPSQSPQQAPPPAAAPAAETATQFSLRYRAAVAKATTLEEVQAFWRADLVKEFNAAPPTQRADLAGIQRIYAMVTDVSATDETSGATGATVTMTGTNPDRQKVTGTAYLIKEGGSWKVFGPERWQ
jgi:hypothetical protein